MVDFPASYVSLLEGESLTYMFRPFWTKLTTIWGHGIPGGLLVGSGFNWITGV